MNNCFQFLVIMNESFYEHMFSFLLNKQQALEVEGLRHGIGICLDKQIARTFPKRLCHFIFQQVGMSSGYS